MLGETAMQMHFIIMKLPRYTNLFILGLFFFLCVPKAEKFGAQGSCRQFAVTLQSGGVKGAGRYRSRRSGLVTPSTQVSVVSVGGSDNC